MLQDHILWRSWTRRRDDILISFSSSFLFVVQHGIRKVVQGYNTAQNNLYITILDTHRYPQGTFQWTVALLRHYNLDENDDQNLLHHYHESEYLAEHSVRICDAKDAHRVPFAKTSGYLVQNRARAPTKRHAKSTCQSVGPVSGTVVAGPA